MWEGGQLRMLRMAFRYCSDFYGLRKCIFLVLKLLQFEDLCKKNFKSNVVAKKDNGSESC